MKQPKKSEKERQTGEVNAAAALKSQRTCEKPTDAQFHVSRFTFHASRLTFHVSETASTVALVALVLVAYGPVWDAGFVWDDDLHVTKNRLLWDSDGLRKIWFSADAPQYYPLTFTTFWLEYHIWGLKAAGYHWVNLLLHGASAVLLWRVLRQLALPGAWLAAALFAVHPVNVESVAWISQRKNVLCMVFGLLSILWYLKAERESKVQSPKSKVEIHPPVGTAFELQGSILARRYYVMSLFAFLLALLSKTAVAPLPLVFLGLAWWRRGKSGKEDLLKSAPFICASILLGLLTVWFERHRTGSPWVMRPESFWAQLAGAGWAVWFYISKALVPLRLSLVYPDWRVKDSSPASYIPLLLFAGLAALFWRNRRSWGRACLFCLACYVVMLLPVLGFMNIGFLNYSRVADHWQYFSVICPIALTVAFLSTPWRKYAKVAQTSKSAVSPTSSRQTVPARCRENMSPDLLRRAPTARLRFPHPALGADNVAFGIVALLSFWSLTWLHSGWFVDAKTLWSHTLAVNPSAWIAHHQLGMELQAEGKSDEAISHYELALRGRPDFAVAEVNWGLALQSRGAMEQAERHILAALRLDPDLPEAHNDLANLLAQERRAQEALTHSLRAVALRPDWAEPHFNAANAYFLLTNSTQAVAEYSAALRLKPDYAEAHQNLGALFEQLGDNQQAAKQYTELVKLRPDFAAAYNRLAIALARQGRFEEAIQNAQQGIRLAADAGQTDLAQDLQNNLHRYQARQP
ncbi:MAG: hypothetical protein C5B50_23200 [Verrucomicrobia bacterium]|nr:MAG: hypothetical protein C5B50_23200 [Verrucomicrobiota bacterium]